MAIIAKYALGISGGTDSSGNGNDLIAGSVTPGQALSHDGVLANGSSVFNASGQWWVGANTAIANTTTTLSFSIWGKWDGTTGVHPLIGMVDKFYLTVNSGGNWELFTYYPTQEQNVIGTATTSWQHIVVVIDGTSLKVYLDTVLEVDTTVAAVGTAGGEDLYIGCHDAFFRFTGEGDDAVFYDHALNQTDVNTLNALPDFDTVDTITITDKIENMPYQVNSSGLADITRTVNYVGSPTSIRARFNGGTWTVVDASPSGGTSTFTLSDQPAGHGLFEVDFSNDALVTDSVTLGIGNIIVSEGQSNADGTLDEESTYTGTQPAFIYPVERTVWTAINDYPQTPGNYTHYRRLANIIEADTNQPVYIVDTAYASTGLYDGSPNTPGDWMPGGKAYDRAVLIINDSGITDALCEVWFQGYNDAFFGTTKSEYETQLPLTLAGLKTATGLTSVETVVVAGLQGSNDPLLDIRAAHLGLWDSEPTLHPGAVLADIDIVSGGGDGIHLKTNVQSEVYCQRLWAMVKAAFLNGTAVRGPRFNSATYTASPDEVLVSFSAVGPLQGAETLGWRVIDDSGTLTVNSAVLQDSTKVLLTLNRGLSTNPLVSWGRNLEAWGTTFRDSQTEIPALNPVEYGAPPEPFVDESVSTTPVVDITSPTTNPTYPTSTSTIDISGTSSISSGTVDIVTWENDRGGSGTCTGTTTWSQNAIPLFSGVNILTVTAESNLGETGTDTLTVTFTPPAPTITITSPTSDPTYATSSATIDLAGTASISSGTVDAVGVTNDRGGGPYTATGTASWSQTGITLFSGDNVLTATATSDLGETATDILTVTYTPPTTGFINLTANWPAGATVTIDSVEYTSNTLIEKAAGSYTCVPNTVEGYTTPASQVATVTVGNTTNISFLWVSDTIRKAPNFRTLKVNKGR